MRLLCYLSLLLSCSCVYAQDFLYVQQWTQAGGLPKPVISAMVDGEQGLKWLATRKGLYTFDGSDFSLVDYQIDSIPRFTEAFFTHIIKDNDGLIWLGSMQQGLFVLDPLLQEIKQFKPSFAGLYEEDVRITALYQDELDRIWVGVNEEGFALFDAEKQDFKYIKPSSKIEGLAKDTRINNIISIEYVAPYLYLGTIEGLLQYHVAKDSFRYVLPCRSDNTVNPSILGAWDKGLRSVVAEGDSVLWLGFWGGGLGRYQIQADRCKNYKLDSLQKDRNNFRLLKRNEQELWVMASQGLLLFDKKTERFERFEHQLNCNFDLGNDGMGFYTDEQGSLWFWTRTALFVYQKNKQLFDFKGIPFRIAEIKQQAQTTNLWISEYLAPNFIVKSTSFNTNAHLIQSYTPTLKKSINYIHQFHFAKDGRVFFMENSHVYIWNPSQHAFELYVELPYVVEEERAKRGLVGSFMDSKDNIWIGTKFDGIIRLDTKNKSWTQFKNEQEDSKFPLVHNDYIRHFFEDENARIWYGAKGGFGYYDYRCDCFENYFFNEDYTSDNADYSMQNISSFAQDKQGRIWMNARRKGLAYVTTKEGLKKPLKLHVIKEQEGGLDAWIQDLEADKNGDIWVSTANGLTRIRQESLALEHYGPEYGLNGGSLSVNETGEVFLASSYRYVHFFPDSIVFEIQKPDVHIQSFSVFDKPLETAVHINQTPSISLSYEQNFFSITFGALNFFNPDRTSFAYQLEGIDKQWVYTKDRKYASYTSLPAGQYTFRLKASLDQEHWGKEKRIQINIHPPFWKTWWFYLLISATFIGLVYAFYNYRIQQIKEQEALKTAFSKQLAEVEMTALRAQMNPHFLFNSLNSIKLLIVQQKNKEAAFYLSKFAKLIRFVLQNSGAQLINLAQELEAIQLYIAIEKLRFESFEYSIKVADDLVLSSVQIPPLLLQPYVENAIWHGLVHTDKVNKLSIKVRKEGNNIVCVIEDNGIGRKQAQLKRKGSLRRSMGMEITRERISLTNNIYGVAIKETIEDLENKAGQACGTRVVLEIKTA